MARTQSVLATRTWWVPVTGQTPAGTVIDTSHDVVKFAFVPVGRVPALPTTPDWHAGYWTSAPDGWRACILVGPGAGGVPLTVGTYSVWLWVVDTPDQPVDLVDTLTVN